jgi:hypothetical protein
MFLFCLFWKASDCRAAAPLHGIVTTSTVPNKSCVRYDTVRLLQMSLFFGAMGTSAYSVSQLLILEHF